MAEGRLSRWSRLKQKGGANDREETLVAEAKAEESTEGPDEFGARLPGGVQVRNFAPAMAPLAPALEEDDDRLTRGVGHSTPDEETATEEFEVAHVDMDIDADDAGDDDLFSGIQEEDLTEEQQELIAGLPPLESLTEQSDFTPFLRDGVPEFLKRKALRVLWRANPLFNFRDGLNDYDEDFNIVHKIIEEGTGAYQVGRGHLSEEELKDMMPEEAQKAFDDDEEEELGDEIKDEEIADTEPNAETVETQEDADEIDDGEDDLEA